MVVTCPKCRVKLKVDEAKLSPEGSRFKCPKCATVLVVKKPAPQAQTALNPKKILAGHSNQALLQSISSVLGTAGYSVTTAQDGIDLIVKALKERPFLTIVEAALPKIYGFEVLKRLKARAETKDMKFILIPAIHDKTKYRREPTTLYGADEYIEEFDVSSQLISKIDRLLGKEDEGKKEEVVRPPVGAPPTPEVSAPEASRPVPEAPRPAPQAPSAPAAGTAAADERVEKARRLSRTIINDIYLYNTEKVMAAIRAGDFYTVFSQELKEGKKLYDSRVPREVREVNDYFKETIDNFIAAKKGV